MKKTDLIALVGVVLEEKCGQKVSKRVAKEVVEIVFDEILNSIKNEGEAVLPGIGKLKLVERRARVGYNPQKQEKIQIPARKTIKLSISKKVKEELK